MEFIADSEDQLRVGSTRTKFTMETRKLIRILPLAVLALTIAGSSANAQDYGNWQNNRRHNHHRNGNGLNIDMVIPGVAVGVYSPLQERTVIIEHNRRYNNGNSVEFEVQRALARAGYYRGPIDGDVGYGTRIAIRDYQIDYGLVPTARINGELLNSLQLR